MSNARNKRNEKVQVPDHAQARTPHYPTSPATILTTHRNNLENDISVSNVTSERNGQILNLEKQRQRTSHRWASLWKERGLGGLFERSVLSRRFQPWYLVASRNCSVSLSSSTRLGLTDGAARCREMASPSAKLYPTLDFFHKACNIAALAMREICMTCQCAFDISTTYQHDLMRDLMETMTDDG